MVAVAGREVNNPSTAPLPSGWEQRVDRASGRIYFLNHNERTTSWETLEPGDTYQLLQVTRPLHGNTVLPGKQVYVADPQGNRFVTVVPANVAPGAMFQVRVPIMIPRRTRRARGAHAPTFRAWHSLDVMDEEFVPTCLLGGAEGGGGVEGAGAGASSPAGGAGGGGRQRGTRFYFDRPQDLLRSMVLRLPRVTGGCAVAKDTGRVAST